MKRTWQSVWKTFDDGDRRRWWERNYMTRISVCYCYDWKKNDKHTHIHNEYWMNTNTKRIEREKNVGFFLPYFRTKQQHEYSLELLLFVFFLIFVTFFIFSSKLFSHWSK